MTWTTWDEEMRHEEMSGNLFIIKRRSMSSFPEDLMDDVLHLPSGGRDRNNLVFPSYSFLKAANALYKHHFINP